MPKRIKEINNFRFGIMGKPQDSRDIPDDAAKYSLNVEPLSDGEISGIPTDQYLKPSGFASNVSVVSYDQGGATSGSSGATQAPNKNFQPPAA